MGDIGVRPSRGTLGAPQQGILGQLPSTFEGASSLVPILGNAKGGLCYLDGCSRMRLLLEGN